MMNFFPIKMETFIAIYFKTVPSPSKLSLSTSWTASSLASKVCSRQVSPLSDRSITISRSFPRNEAKCGTSMITGLNERD